MSPVLQALNPWFDEYAVKPLSYVNPVAVSDAIAPGEAVALDLPPSGAAADFIQSSDGGVEGHAGYIKPARAVPEIATAQGCERDIQAGIESGPSEANSGAPQQPRGEPVHTDATQPMGSPHLTYAETIAQLEALLQGYRDFDDTGRDITDANLVYADPPPIYLRRARA